MEKGGSGRQIDPGKTASVIKKCKKCYFANYKQGNTQEN